MKTIIQKYVCVTVLKTETDPSRVDVSCSEAILERKTYLNPFFETYYTQRKPFNKIDMFTNSRYTHVQRVFFTQTILQRLKKRPVQAPRVKDTSTLFHIQRALLSTVSSALQPVLSDGLHLPLKRRQLSQLHPN